MARDLTRVVFRSIICTPTIMKQTVSKRWMFWNRAILVVGALVCLCLSDSVGPRLLPLPTLVEPAAGSLVQLDSGPRASRAPNSKSAGNTRIEMAPGRQYRARDRHHHLQPATAAPQAWLQLQPTKLAVAPASYTTLKSSTASVSKPSGRGPPLLV